MLDKKQPKKRTAREIIDGFAEYVKQLVTDLAETGESNESIVSAFSGRYPTFSMQILQAVITRRLTAEAANQGVRFDSAKSGPDTGRIPDAPKPKEQKSPFLFGEDNLTLVQH